MGLSQALFSGMSGLITHNRCMDNLGNNLANVNTVGFKKGVFQFATILEQVYRGGMGPAANGGLGSINPIGMGIGVTTGAIDKDFTQGPVESTGNPTDMAIDGNGFFVVQNGDYRALTRDGHFKIAQLVNPQTNLKTSVLMNSGGMPVLGYRANELGVIPASAPLDTLPIEIGKIGGARATTTATFGGNINKDQPVTLGTRIAGPSVASSPAWLGRDLNTADATWAVLNASAAAETPAVVNGGNVLTSAALGMLVWAVPVDAAGNPDVGDPARVTRRFISLDAAQADDPNCRYYAITAGRSETQDKTDLMANIAARAPANPAGLDTGLRDVFYYNGAAWVQPFADIKNGDAIDVQFNLGANTTSSGVSSQRTVTASFVYNNISELPQAQTHARSSTLRDWMTFLAGGVDDPVVVASYERAATPQTAGGENLYRAAENPNWLVDYQGRRRDAAGNYLDALGNSVPAANAARGTLVEDPAFDASAAGQARLTGGVMGTVKIPPLISPANGGDDLYGVPAESAGAYTRLGYDRLAYNANDLEADTFNLSIVSNLGAENALSNLQISFNGVRFDGFFADDRAYQDKTGGGTATNFEIYDSTGSQYTGNLRLALVGRDSNFSTYRWYSDSPADTDNLWLVDADGNIISNAFTGTGTIRFDVDGKLVPVMSQSETGGISIDRDRSGTSTPVILSFQNGAAGDYRQALDFSGLSQVSDPSSKIGLTEQDGRPAGTLQRFAVASDGTIEGIFSNGVSLTLGQIALAMTPNNTGLVTSGDNLFYEGAASGMATFAGGGIGGRGAIRQGWLETSNVELAEEFTRLITTERGFQANARTISTVDEMLVEIVNLKR